MNDEVNDKEEGELSSLFNSPRARYSRTAVARQLEQHLVGAMVLTVLLAGFAWLVLRPHERLYQGRALSAWVREAEDDDSRWGWNYRNRRTPWENLDQRLAARTYDLATNLLPEVLELVSTRETVFRMVVGEMAEDESMSFLHLPPQRGKHRLAVWVCHRLGGEASPLVPGLIALLRDKDASVQMDAAHCLAQIGQTAQAAVPALISAWSGARNQKPWINNSVRESILEALVAMGPAARQALPYIAGETNELYQLAVLQIKGESLAPVLARLRDQSNLQRWSEIMAAIGQQGTNAAEAVPMLLELLVQTNRPIPQIGSSIHQQVLQALGQIRSQPELCVPALMPLLRSSNVNLRVGSLTALRAFGPAARRAAPQVLNNLQDREPWVRREATNTLRAIDPESAGRAGVAPLWP